MKNIYNNFFTSGWDFTESEIDLRSKVQMINVSILLSIFGFLYEIIVNLTKNIEGLIPVEILILSLNIIMLILLRKNRKSVHAIATFLTAQYTFFFTFLIYASEPESLKHIWLFTFPLILLYFQGTKKGIYWLVLIVAILFAAPFQPFVTVSYSLFQITYVIFSFLIITALIYFYQYKMNEVHKLTFKQQKMLKEFNNGLEEQVKIKTFELNELNESLEKKVQDKLQEIIKRDRILEAQSKQAVMGEMISMIAHQWRQPLSTITLQISHMQFKKLLGQELDEEETDKTLTRISDTIIYLSDTIDDFLNYFNPDKEADEIELKELLQKAVNLAIPKAKKGDVKIVLDIKEEIEILTYINELVQVILNLLNNAIDALVESSKDDLVIKITTQIQDEHIIINVIDNANGISDENLLHLFEPYFSTKGKNGTGLGLYMSQMIVEKQLEGKLDVVSSSHGTIFTINIPSNL